MLLQCDILLLDMVETPIKYQQIDRINDGRGKLGVVVSFAPSDVPSLSSQAAQTRLEAAKSKYGATAIAGRLGTVRAALLSDYPYVGRILVATNASDFKRPDVLEQEAGVLDAVAQNVHALAVGYHKHSEHAPEQRRLFRGIREEAQREGAEFPIFTFLYPGIEEYADERANGVRDAVERGADAVVVDHSNNDRKVVEAAYPSVPVYIRLDGDFVDPMNVLTQAAEARDAGAKGVVIGKLSERDDQPTPSKMIAGISEVVRDNKSPEEAYTKATTSIR